VTPPDPLDNPVRSSLAGPHARFAQLKGNALRYPADVSPFFALPDQPDDADWADLAALAGPGALVALAGVRVPPPAGWEVTLIGEGVQLIDVEVEVGADGEAAAEKSTERLGLRDVPEMLELAGRTKPGPFLPRTVELGRYIGIRRHGALVAMAGERLHPPGWTEISAVCTDDAWRGLGLATQLVRVLVAGIRSRGETAFLHALADNTTAISLYEGLGFRLSRGMLFTVAHVPADDAD
jgi:ribosomal protein S18 acetylase RimI-like enzyme